MKKLALILDKKEKIKVLVLSFFGILNSIAESISIALILPILTIILNKKKFDEDLIFFNFINSLIDKFEMNVSALLIFLVLIYVVKSSFQLFFIWFQNKTSLNIEYNVSKRVFRGFLKQNYQNSIKYKSAEIIEILSREVKNLGSCLIQITNLILEITLIFILIFIMLFSFGTIFLKILATLAILVFLIYLLVGKNFKSWGFKRHQAATNSLTNMFHGINSFKEIKLYKRENFFINKYTDNLKISLGYVVLMNFFSSIPRILYEILFIVLIFTYIYFQSKSGLNFETHLPMIAFIGAAIIRILPGLSKISTAIAQIISFTVSVEKIFNLTSKNNNDLNENHLKDVENKIKKLDFNKIEFKNVSYKYAKQKKNVINDLNLTISKGDHIGIKGHTGSGKTTLVNLLCGLINLNGGEINIDNIEISKINNQWQKNIGYVPQKIYLIDDTIKNNILFGSQEDEQDKEKLDKILSISQCKDFIKNLPNGVDNKVGENGILLSGGQIQRIGVARALYSQPGLLIMDEATNALDIDTEKKLLKELSDKNIREKITIISISHKESALSCCNKVYTLDKGRLVLL